MTRYSASYESLADWTRVGGVRRPNGATSSINGEAVNQAPTARLRRLSAKQWTGPAPVALGAEELHPLHVVIAFRSVPRPSKRRRVIGELADVDYVAHPVEKPIAGHADYRSARRPSQRACSSTV